MGGDKEYQGEIIFGIETDSQDAEGKVVSRREVSLTREAVAEAIAGFIGRQKQIPPMVSALHHKGERLYKLAREGRLVERPAREIEIKDFKLLEFQDGENPRASFVLTCSKGTYVRTICHDLGKRLGCGAHQSALVRLRSGPFKLEEAFTLEDLERLKESDRLNEAILPTEKILERLA